MPYSKSSKDTQKVVAPCLELALLPAVCSFALSLDPLHFFGTACFVVVLSKNKTGPWY